MVDSFGALLLNNYYAREIDGKWPMAVGSWLNGHIGVTRLGIILMGGMGEMEENGLDGRFGLGWAIWAIMGAHQLPSAPIKPHQSPTLHQKTSIYISSSRKISIPLQSVQSVSACHLIMPTAKSQEPMAAHSLHQLPP